MVEFMTFEKNVGVYLYDDVSTDIGTIYSHRTRNEIVEKHLESYTLSMRNIENLMAIQISCWDNFVC